MESDRCPSARRRARPRHDEPRATPLGPAPEAVRHPGRAGPDDRRDLAAVVRVRPDRAGPRVQPAPQDRPGGAAPGHQRLGQPAGPPGTDPRRLRRPVASCRPRQEGRAARDGPRRGLRPGISARRAERALPLDLGRRPGARPGRCASAGPLGLAHRRRGHALRGRGPRPARRGGPGAGHQPARPLSGRPDGRAGRGGPRGVVPPPAPGLARLLGLFAALPRLHDPERAGAQRAVRPRGGPRGDARPGRPDLPRAGQRRLRPLQRAAQPDRPARPDRSLRGPGARGPRGGRRDGWGSIPSSPPAGTTP